MDQSDISDKIYVEGLYKIFGPEPEKGLDLLKEGGTKDEVQKKTGMTVGVQDATFSVREGEIFVVMGLSGSGKSTLVRMLNRLIVPTSGSVMVNGEDVIAMTEKQLVELRRGHMAMVFQSFALMPHLSVLENVAFGLEIGGFSKKERLKRSEEALEQVGLSAYCDVTPAELSGGQQQRVGLARGLAVNPEIMLMDEAFSALDPLIRTEMQDELLKIQDQHARTIIFISHDLDEAMRIGDRIAIMENGGIVQVGTPEEILQKPANDYVRAFFRGVDPTHILKLRDIAKPEAVVLQDDISVEEALKKLKDQGLYYGCKLDQENRVSGIVSRSSLQNLLDNKPDEERKMEDAFLRGVVSVKETDSMQEILPEVASNPHPLPVLDEEGRYKGMVSKDIFLNTLHRDRGEE
ncbi:MAG: glycine betaine/L-proline ABC transporter ATP-binding protein ProV [Desulfurivibrionaceae bacterium]